MWWVLPQGFTKSPCLLSGALKEDLGDLKLDENTYIVIYIDDILIASPDKDTHEKDCHTQICFTCLCACLHPPPGVAHLPHHRQCIYTCVLCGQFVLLSLPEYFFLFFFIFIHLFIYFLNVRLVS